MSDEFIKAEMDLFAKQCKDVDIIITTAAIPGKKAPRLITKEMVASMKPGSVIVDLAAATGGICDGKVADCEVTFPPPKISVSAAPKAKADAAAPAKQEPKKASPALKIVALAAIVVAFMLIGGYAPEKFLPHFTVFVLACVVGYYVVWNVSHSLHTPLMSVTNAISGIVVVGAMVQIGDSIIIGILAFIGVLLVSINIFGGFAVTRRMLAMFRKQQ